MHAGKVTSVHPHSLHTPKIYMMSAEGDDLISQRDNIIVTVISHSLKSAIFSNSRSTLQRDCSRALNKRQGQAKFIRKLQTLERMQL